MAGEKNLQTYFRNTCEAAGILWRKIRFEGRRGCPDTLVAKNGKAVLVELKNPNRRGLLSKLQIRQIADLRAAGLDVRVVDSKEELDMIVKELNDG